jgi:hypothetical protein
MLPGLQDRSDQTVTRLARSLTSVVLLAVAGCAYHPRALTLQASATEWRALVGEWRGSYSSDGGDRHGLIDLSLAAGEQQAYGDVLMVAAGSRDRYYPSAAGERMATAERPHGTILTIRFVRAADGRLTGTMDPYWDPERSCEATATFYGAIGDGRMDGTFTSLCADGVHAIRGHWSVLRRHDPEP